MSVAKVGDWFYGVGEIMTIAHCDAVKVLGASIVECLNDGGIAVGSPMPFTFLAGDRACCLWYQSYEAGKAARERGEPCEYRRQPAQGFSPKSNILINKDLWERGWKGEPMPDDIVNFCSDT